jgi:hypothetical protein
MFSSGRYWLVVVVEFAAIVVGAVLLSRAGYSAYSPVWVVFVVGVHFFGFGHFFWRGFYLLGGALIAAGVIGAIVGVAGGGASWIIAITGILAAISLFTSGTRVFRSAPQRPNPSTPSR